MADRKNTTISITEFYKIVLETKYKLQLSQEAMANSLMWEYSL